MHNPKRQLVIALIVTLGFYSGANAQGIFLPASGAVNRAMAGATTGAAIDSIGSLYWNPATISGLRNNEMALGFEAIYADYRVESTFPGAGTGSSSAESGAVPVPSIGWVHQTANPNVKIGLGLFGAAGFSTNLPTSPTNPVLSPPPTQGGVGLGRVQADAVFFQMSPVISVALTDRLAIGGGPVINTGKIPLDQNIFVTPNADSLHPRGNGTRYHWGLGAQLGFYYVHDCCWQFGANIKTPMWFETFRYFSEDANGLPRVDEVDATLPLIVSLGTAYSGIPHTLIAVDLRFLNYSDSEGFGGDAGYDATGAVTGLGWNDQFSVHLGLQREMSQRLTGRAGYGYVTNLIDDAESFFSLGADLSYRHYLGVGASYRLTPCVAASFAYNYLPQWESSGPIVLPGFGAFPGSSVTTRVDSHIATIGINVAY